MNKFRLVPISLVIFASSAFSQGLSPFTGRWDFTVTSARGTYPQWMELTEKDGAPQIRIQPRGGAVRPAVAAKVEGSHLLITVASAAGDRPEVKWDLTASGGKLTGTQKSGDAVDAQLAAVRAPELKRPEPKAWTTPEPLFNGKDLTGWEPIGDPSKSHWVAKNNE